jgi:CubicO group peptidase (beta-lactamase class C family)
MTRIPRNRIALVIAVLLSVFARRLHAQDTEHYFPGRFGDWEVRDPQQVGMNAARLAEAVDFAIASENPASRNLADTVALSFANEPFNEIVGPTTLRGAANGLVVRNGYIVAEWGDTNRVDMTFSCTKSYLSTVAGLAVDDGLIHDVHDPLKKYVRDGHFDSEHNANITWHHLLNQTSDWSGTLWDKPDWADRPVGDDRQKWIDRELHEPGSLMKYNDVRVNLLAYSLLQVYRRPLPEILRARIMDPIGGSPTWRWHGYRNSWVVLDGRKIQSVSGGGHWGGGMFICSRDHARLGYLFLRNGKWMDRQLISNDWIDALRVPTDVRSDYGYMWWLNTDQKKIPAAPASAFYAAGFGGNYVYVDQENDLVVVLRWTPNLAEVIEKILAAVE